MRPQVVIIATILLNSGLFVANLEVALSSGSHTVLSQAFYTIADLVGGVFLLWGFVVSKRPPDDKHPFGRGKERFFWAFTASIVTFTIAGLLTIFSGLQQVVAPQPLDHLPVALAVVGLTLGVSLVGIEVTLRELRRDERSVASLLESAHQGLKTIFYQDLVSVVGSVLAFGGIGVVYVTNNVRIDGWTAAAVGFVLVATGFVLAAESRSYLVGRAIPPELARDVLHLVERDARVRKVREVQSMLLGPDDVLLALRVNFQDGLTTDQIERTIDDLTERMRSHYPVLRHVVLEPEA